MKRIITILIILISLKSDAQMMSNGTKFIWSALTGQSPTSYNNAGTVVVRRKHFENLNIGTLSGYDVSISGTTNITFIDCSFGPSISNGVTIVGFTGTAKFIRCLFWSNRVSIEFSASTGGVVQVEDSWCVNPWGAPQCKGQFIQFESVTTPNSYVRNLKGESFMGEGNTEDWVSMYTSTGTTNPIHIDRNSFRGGGPSESGGGIMSGDTDGGNQLIENNKLFNVGNYQLAIASGEGITVRNNKFYQINDGVSTIACYIYGGQNGATTCADHEMSGNSGNFWNINNLFYGGDGSPSEDCGDIIGIGAGYVADGNAAWLETNDNDLTLSELNFPAVLIDCVSEDILWRIRDRSTEFDDEGGCKNTDQRARPTANAGSNTNIFASFATLTGSGGDTYQWTLVSGPNIPTQSAPTAATNNITGLVNGVYLWRLVVTNTTVGSADAAWIYWVVDLT